MDKNCCEKCNTRECEYIELKGFISCINELEKKKFMLSECPDKKCLDYTCDLVYSDEKSEEKIYIECKKVLFGMGEKKEKDINMGKSRGQDNYAESIIEVVEKLSEKKAEELRNYIVSIPKKNLFEIEKDQLKTQLYEKLNKIDFEKKPENIEIDFKSNKEIVTICFKRKSEKSLKFGENMLFEYKEDKEDTVAQILDEMTDVNLLKKLISYNLKKTSKIKFPHDDGRKILLNIIDLPKGKESFFELHLKDLFEEIMSMDNTDKTAANEVYLLYHSSNYIVSDGKKVEQFGPIVFIAPLIKGIIDEPVYLMIQ